MNKKLQIHNSTAEFLIFQIENKEEGIEVLYQDESLWLTQDAIGVLFDKSRSTITEHLQNI
ncbi:phosphoribosylaminoimidazolesuccinocarboxamide synthase, partial [Escherichia coli]|nr:phosphoribosylaminoimidazolesuccinocarboxamide synthase [Escherichia coli]